MSGLIRGRGSKRNSLDMVFGPSAFSNQPKQRCHSLERMDSLLQEKLEKRNSVKEPESPRVTLESEKYKSLEKLIEGLSQLEDAVESSEDVKKGLVPEFLFSINIQKEFQALYSMANQANATGVSIEEGVKYFRANYGDNELDQLFNIILEFNRLPSEVLDEKEIRKEFVTKAFIRIFKEFEFYADFKQTIFKLKLDHENLYRVPMTIGWITSVKHIILACQVTHFPPQILLLPALEKVEFENVKINSDLPIMVSLKELIEKNQNNSPNITMPKTGLSTALNLSRKNARRNHQTIEKTKKTEAMPESKKEIQNKPKGTISQKFMGTVRTVRNLFK